MAMREKVCACGRAFAPRGGRQLRCGPCREAAAPPPARRQAAFPQRECGCGRAFAPRSGTQRRCAPCREAAAAEAYADRALRRREAEAEAAAAREAAPPPPADALLLGEARADLERLREAAEGLLRSRAGDVSAYSKGASAAAATLLAAAGFSRHPTEPRYAGREEMAALRAAGLLGD